MKNSGEFPVSIKMYSELIELDGFKPSGAPRAKA